MNGELFRKLIDAELKQARESNPKKFNSLHEGYGVLLEEVDEFWDEVKKNNQNRDAMKICSELVQVAAIAQAIAEDLL